MTEAINTGIQITEARWPESLDGNMRFRSEIDVRESGLTQDELSRVYTGMVIAGISAAEGRDASGLLGFSLRSGATPNEMRVTHRGVGDQSSVVAGIRSETNPLGAQEFVLIEAGRAN